MELEALQHEAESLADVLKKSKRLIIFSGAGMSAESGISTFRQPEVGIWANKVGLAYFGTPFGWWLTPGLAWKTYLRYFRNPIAAAKPNEGHIALGLLEKLMSDENKRVVVVTQNVDGLHQRAGSGEVYELHGTVYRHVCSKQKHSHEYVIDVVGLDATDYNAEEDTFFDMKKYPTCSTEGCNSYLRPDAVLFTESLPGSEWDPAMDAIYSLEKGDLLIVVGTSGLIYPAASIPEIVARQGKAKIIEINPEKSSLTKTIVAANGSYLETTSATFLPLLYKEYEKLMSK